MTDFIRVGAGGAAAPLAAADRSAAAADGDFEIVPLYASGKIRNAASLDFELTQVLAVCDARQLPRPPMLTAAISSFPYRIVLTELCNRLTSERIGRLQRVLEDGTCIFDQRWQIARSEK